MIFFTGFLVGMVSLIPGISGGTILVITKKYDVITQAICNYRKKENIFLLFAFVIGLLLGSVTFARIIEFLFFFFPNETMIVFGGFILFHFPMLLKSEKEKPKLLWIILGALIILFLQSLSPAYEKVILTYPTMNLAFLVYFTFCGCIDGFFTILPGISGSMIMMILGPYFLYKSFLANLSIANLYLILPLSCYLLGDAVGFFLGSKFSVYFFQKHHRFFFSIILGMVFMSIFILLPPIHFSIQGIFSYSVSFFLSYLLYKIIHSLL